MHIKSVGRGSPLLNFIFSNFPANIKYNGASSETNSRHPEEILEAAAVPETVRRRSDQEREDHESYEDGREIAEDLEDKSDAEAAMEGGDCFADEAFGEAEERIHEYDAEDSWECWGEGIRRKADSQSSESCFGLFQL
ncbi:hypothetical protein V6N13_071998 [Hibiscus sabdariffa]